MVQPLPPVVPEGGGAPGAKAADARRKQASKQAMPSFHLFRAARRTAHVDGPSHAEALWGPLSRTSSQSVASSYPLLLGEVVFDLGAYIKISSNVTLPLVLNGQTIGHMKLAISIVT